MPTPHGQSWFSNSAFDISRDSRLRPGEHWFVISQDAAQTTNRRGICHRVSVIDVMAISRSQRGARNLVHADEQLAGALGTQHFLNEAIDLRISEGIDVFEPDLLLVESLAKQARGVRVIK